MRFLFMLCPDSTTLFFKPPLIDTPWLNRVNLKLPVSLDNVSVAVGIATGMTP
jgi:hypothetical protein